MQTRMEQSAGRDFSGHAQPACVEPVEEACNWLLLQIEFLQLKVEQSRQVIHSHASYDKAIELMAMNCQMAKARIFPLVLLVDLHSDEV
jgi:hypothetical protein